MDSVYRNKLQLYLTGRNWYQILPHDIQRSIELADHLQLDVIPDRIQLQLHWIVTVGNGGTDRKISIDRNNNNYTIKIDDGNLKPITHTSF